MNGVLGFSIRQMITASVIAIVLGLVMLFYPGGTMALMAGAFWSVQLILSIFIGIYAISEIIRNSAAERVWAVVVSIILGILAIAFIWLFDVGFVYFIIACFFVLAGITEIVGSFSVPFGKFFIFLLGAINIMIGGIIFKHPVILPLLIAWYILFWGVSRLLLALELKSMMK